MKLTRRQLMVATGSAVAVKAIAQSAPAIPGAPAAPRDFAKESLDGVQRNRETLTKFVIPMSTEPAFVFKA